MLGSILAFSGFSSGIKISPLNENIIKYGDEVTYFLIFAILKLMDSSEVSSMPLNEGSRWPIAHLSSGREMWLFASENIVYCQ